MAHSFFMQGINSNLSTTESEPKMTYIVRTVRQRNEYCPSLSFSLPSIFCVTLLLLRSPLSAQRPLRLMRERSRGLGSTQVVETMVDGRPLSVG